MSINTQKMTKTKKDHHSKTKATKKPKGKTKKKNILKRPEFSKVIYLGSASKEVIQAVSEMFPDHKVYVMDAEMFGAVTDLFIKQHIKWKEMGQMREYITKAENISYAHEAANKVLRSVGSGWFSIKDMVENTSFNHGQIRSILDILYAFGLVAYDKTNPKKTIYKVIQNNYQKIEYVKNLQSGLEKEAKEMEDIIKQIQADIDSGSEGELKQTKSDDSVKKEPK